MHTMNNMIKEVNIIQYHLLPETFNFFNIFSKYNEA
jgi:hypothetical protein